MQRLNAQRIGQMVLYLWQLDTFRHKSPNFFGKGWPKFAKMTLFLHPGHPANPGNFLTTEGGGPASRKKGANSGPIPAGLYFSRQIFKVRTPKTTLGVTSLDLSGSNPRAMSGVIWVNAYFQGFHRRCPAAHGQSQRLKQPKHTNTTSATCATRHHHSPTPGLDGNPWKPWGGWGGDPRPPNPGGGGRPPPPPPGFPTVPVVAAAAAAVVIVLRQSLPGAVMDWAFLCTARPRPRR